MRSGARMFQCLLRRQMQRASTGGEAESSTSTQASQLLNQRKKWEELLFGHYDMQIDVERSVKAGSTIIAILQFGTSAHERFEIRDYIKIIKLALNPSPFQEQLFLKVRELLESNDKQLMQGLVRDMYILRNKQDGDRNNIAWMLNLLVKNCFEELSPLDKELGLLNMLESELVHPTTLKKYMQGYGQVPSPGDFRSATEQIHWCYHRLTNMVVLQQHLHPNEFTKLVTLKHYEYVVSRYLTLLEDESNRLLLFEDNLNCNVMLYGLPFASQTALTRTVKERLSKVWEQMANSQLNSGMFLFNKVLFNYRSFYFLFNRVDRFVARGFLTNFFDYMFRVRSYRWSSHRHCLAFMSYYQVIDTSLYFSALATLRDKLFPDKTLASADSKLGPNSKSLSLFAHLYCLNIDEIVGRELSDFVNVSLQRVKARYSVLVGEMLGKGIDLKLPSPRKWDDTEKQDEAHLHKYDAMLEMVPQSMVEKRLLKRLRLGEDLSNPYNTGLELKRMQETLGFYRMYPFANRLSGKYSMLHLNSLVRIFRVWLTIDNPDQRLLKQLISFLNSPETLQLAASMICYPGFLDNLLLMEAAHKATQPSSSLFEEPLARIVQNAHLGFQEVFASLKQPAVEELERSPKHRNAICFKPHLWQFMLNPERNPVNFYEDRAAGHKPMLYHNPKDLSKELYVATKENILLNSVHSPLASYILENSELKDSVKKIVESTEGATRILADVVEYPFFADFLVEAGDKKLAVYVVDFSKMYSGVSSVVHHEIRLSMEHFRRQGYSIAEIGYEDYTVSDRAAKIKAKLQAHLK